MEKNKVKWGILGFARIAKNEIIPAIMANSNSEFYAIASRYQEKLNECKELFNCERTYLSYEQLLNDPDVQAVYIPLPNSLHKEWAIKALEQGKHVLCEKPISMNITDCEEMIEASIRNNRILMEAFMYRYTDRIKKVLEILNSQVVGEIRYLSSTYRFLLDRPNTIKVRSDLGGGSLYDVGCYPVNFLGMILNELPVSYKAECIIENGVDIIFSGILKYRSGVIATINSGFNSQGKMYSEIVGTKGTIEIPDTFADTKGKIRIITSSDQKVINVTECDRYLLEIFHFTNAIVSDNGNLHSLQESLRNTEVIVNLLMAANVVAH